MDKVTLEIKAPTYLAKVIYTLIKESNKYCNNVVDVRVIKNSNNSNKNCKEVIETVIVGPTVEEVKQYADKTGSNVSPERFVNYYSSRDWENKDGSKITDWKLKFDDWGTYKLERGDKQNKKKIEESYNMMDEWSCA